MRRSLRLAVSWLAILTLFTGFFPGKLFVSPASAASGDLLWPNPGAVNLTKTADPTGEQGKWKVTLTVEGKNIKTTSDVVLVIDLSASMKQSGRMTNAKTAAAKFVNNLLYKDSTTRIGLVTFDKTGRTLSDFKGTEQKSNLLNTIDGIKASNEGTNIQAGIHSAEDLLAGSQAQNKVIVVLSDGAPTYSYKASGAQSYTWPDKKYNFALSNFTYTSKNLLGSGTSYDLNFSERYSVSRYTVSDNGIATLSEAKLAQDQGYGIYSVGLEVGNDKDAQYILQNIQNQGYVPSSSSDLDQVFAELSGKISYAAVDAKVIDPMGDMFDLVGAPEVSQGEISWDKNKETFTWNIGNIIEGSPATLTYVVQMDQSKHPDANKLYPTNGTTTLTYTDINGNDTSKNFDVPKVSFGKGSITYRGYLVNAEGKPVNADGVVVDRPDLAEQLYSDLFTVNDSTALDINQSYSVPAKTLEGYEVKAGSNPAAVQLTLSVPNPTVWFGYVKAPYNFTAEFKAGDTEISQAEVIQKYQGDAVDYSSKNIEGYTFKDASLSPDSGLSVQGGHVTGTMPNKDVTVTFHYEPVQQQVTVKYLEKDTGKQLADPTAKTGVVGEKIDLTAPSIDGYTPEKADASYTFTAAEGQEYIFTYTADRQTVTVKYLEQGTGNELSRPTVENGVTDGTVTLQPAPVDGYTPVETSANYTFNANPDQTYTFYYTKDIPPVEQRTVTVNYQEQGTGFKLAEPMTFTEDVGSTKHLTAEPITLEDGTSYTPVNSEYDYTVTDGEAQSYTFYYTKDVPPPAEQGSVTVHYVYQDPEAQEPDAELQDPTVTTGNVGDYVNLTAAPITVSEVVYIPLNFNYDYQITGDPEQQYTFYYETGSLEDVKHLTVKYVDESNPGVELYTEQYLGREGEYITIRPGTLTYEGSTYQPKETPVSYTFTEAADQELIIYFTKENEEPPATEDQTVTISYLEQGTNAVLSAPTEQKGQPGSKVTLTAPAISGYTPVEAQHEYQFGDQDGQQYIFYYTKNTPVDPPSNPSTPSTPVVTPLPPAPPVTPLPPAPPALEKEKHFNYINGYPDGLIKPENNISREEVAAIFYRLMDDATRSDYIKNSTDSFKDVGPTRWSSKYIATMENAGIITGYVGGTFKPEQPITRAEFAAIASRFDDLDLQENSQFSDIAGTWAEKYIVSAANKGWIKGYQDGTFKPDQYITRAEAMAFINSELNRKVDADGIADGAKVWPDNPQSKWYYADVVEATNYHDYTRKEDGSETWGQILPDRIYP